ncbi:MFS transporter [Alteraurantiacibacter aestuarii]|uniref:MFS transporter n=1 Tax=Alteraurantiacibacter aestuarii TaxID=650004 RepID=UPI0031CDC443
MASTDAEQGGTTPAYQTMMVVLLGVNMGVVFLDRNAFGLLAPMIQPEFNLTNTQIGMITGVLAVTWAFSSYGLTRLADITGRTKALLIFGTVIFSIASISSGMAIGFLTLLAARALMGIAEGGLPPLSTHIVTTEVAPERRGLAIGTLSTLGINAIPLLGPLVIVGIGTVYGWREAFWIAGIPGLIMAALIWFLVRNPPRETFKDAPVGGIRPLLRTYNIRISMVLATLNMAFFASLLGFFPLYLVNVHGFSNAMMGVVLTVIGGASVFYGFVVPMLSDKYGRKAALMGSYAIAVTGLPLMIFSGGSMPMLFAGGMLAVAGAAGSGILIMNVIPGESAPPNLRATAMGFNAAVGEMLGAGAMPVVIGMVADRFGLSTLPWILAVLAAAICAVTLALQETAPRLVAARSA